MRSAVFILSCASLVLVSCHLENSLEQPNEAWAAAERHMHLADTLEHSMALREATMEYAIVAQYYPTTGFHRKAVLRAAILYSNPLNPAGNDSIAGYWFRTYRDIAATPAEVELIDLYLGALERIKLVRTDLARQTLTVESLTGANRKQSNELAQRQKRIQDLEADNKKITDELKRLLEIDLKMHKNRSNK